MKPWQYIAVGCILASLLVSAFFIGRATAPAAPVEPLSRDTVIVTRTDTIVRERPVYYATTVVDTVLVAVTDTVRLRDTLYMEIEREQRAYRDTTYEAWVSGYRPALDSIRIYSPVRCVTVTERVPVEVSRKWSLSITAGYGATLSGNQIKLAPFIGAGISYNILSW